MMIKWVIIAGIRVINTELDILSMLLGYLYERYPNIAIRAKGRISDALLKLDALIDILDEVKQ